MSNANKVVWSEGIFLGPHHFQQQERYIEQLVDGRCRALSAYGWGLSQIKIDQQLLTLGKLAITEAKGIFPDGTPFSVPDASSMAVVLEIPADVHNQEVYLGVPIKRSDSLEVVRSNQTEGAARYQLSEHQTWDTASEVGEVASIDVAKLRVRLLLESDDLSGYACIGIARIKERRDNKQIILDEDYIPSCLNIEIVPRLAQLLRELSGLLHHRAEALSERLAESGRAGAAEIADYLMLQVLNRIEPLINHLGSVEGLHPERLYTELLQIAGELASFTNVNKRPIPFPNYLHAHLQETFAPVMQALRQQLSTVIERSAVSIEWVERKYGIRVATLHDRESIGSAQFVLAVKASVATEKLRRQFPAHAKLGSVERIRELVNAQMNGIALHPLPVAPRQIPYHSGFVYFELDRTSDFWQRMRQSGGLALHVGADYPDLELELWAIRY